MSETKFTPLCLSPNRGYIRRTLHGYNIASLDGMLDDDERIAYGQLFAAAPDLYAALELALEAWVNGDGGAGTHELMAEAMQAGRNALSRARGES